MTSPVKQGPQGGLWCSGLSISRARNTPGYGQQQFSHRKYWNKVVSTKDYCSSDADCLCHTHSFPQQVTLLSDKTVCAQCPGPAVFYTTDLGRVSLPNISNKLQNASSREEHCHVQLKSAHNPQLCCSASLWELVCTFTARFVQQLCFAFLSCFFQERFSEAPGICQTWRRKLTACVLILHFVSKVPDSENKCLQRTSINSGD